MAAPSVFPQDADGRPVLFYLWRLALVVTAAINLSAFWFLLQYRYSGEHYRADPTVPGGIELTWIEVSVCVAIVAVVLSWRNADASRRLVRAGLVATAVSMIVLMKTLAGAPLRCLDAILFSVACGWAMVVWLRTGEALNPDRTLPLRLGGCGWHPKTVTALAAAVWIAGAGLFLYYMRQQVHYLNNLALGYVDCGDPARLMYNTLHNARELFMRVNPDKALFYDHFLPGVLPVVPLWSLWPDLKLTILLQVVAVLGCAIPIYWIGTEVFRDKAAALLVVAVWLVFPSTSLFIYCGSYGFRWGDLCLPLYFLALACWLKDRRGCALLFAVWAILIKEEAAILIGTFGVYLALFEKRRWMGAVIAIAALAYFLLISSVILPAMTHRGYMAQNIFADLGASKWEILLSPLTKPRIFWGRLFEPSSLYFAALLLAPVLFVPLKRPAVLSIGSLIFLVDCLHPTLKSICYWYQAALLPVVFWALVAALRTDHTARQRATLSGAVVAGVLLSLFFGNTCWSKDTFLPPLSPGRLHLVQRMGRQIDRSSSLFATQRVAAHFITQKYLYVDLPLPSSIDYVLLDLRDSWREIPDVSWLRGLCALQRQVAARPDLHLVDAEDGLLLYARHGVPLDPRTLVERDALPSDATPTERNLTPGVKIVGFKVDPVPPPEGDMRLDLMRVTIFSAATAPTNADLAVRCTLQSHTIGTETDSFVSKLQPLGQGIWPIARWLPGKVYTESFLISLPAGMSREQFSVDITAIPLTD
jgi:uncharacterized membrane protein